MNVDLGKDLARIIVVYIVPFLLLGAVLWVIVLATLFFRASNESARKAAKKRVTGAFATTFIFVFIWGALAGVTFSLQRPSEQQINFNNVGGGSGSHGGGNSGGGGFRPPSNDRIFKLLLTHPDAEKVLIDVVSTVINRKVVAVQIRNIELPLMDINEKDERLDVNCTIDTGDQVDVEMHSCPQEEIGKEFINFVNKYIYYLTDLHSSQKSKGKKYYELVRTYQVTFCMKTVLPDWPNFVNKFSLRNANGRLLSDQLNMIIIELDKLDALLKKPVDKMTSFEKWSLFFKFAQEDGIQREKINDMSLFQNSVSFGKDFRKTSFKAGFSFKSKVAFPKLKFWKRLI